jgi:hypothetical protein
MIKKTILSAAICASLILGSAGVALAGEITGTGESLQPLHAKSLCAFSGLEDFNNGAAPVEPGVVQSFGNHVNSPDGGVAQGNRPDGGGPAAPGIYCNPSGQNLP